MFRSWLVLLVVLHSLFILNTLRTPSPNVFTALNIPINTPTNVIRAILFQKHSRAVYPWLDRLDSFQFRSLYVRFGHDVVLTCDHCQTIEDYALYALPRPALAYIREIAVVGLVTLERLNRSHLRPVGVGILVAAFVAEAYLLGTAPIAVPLSGSENTYMWHDQLLFYRHLLFLALPLLLSVLPFIARSPILTRIPIVSLFIQPALPLASFGGVPAEDMSPTQLKSHLMQSCLRTLEQHLLPSLRLQTLTHAALMRDPELRARASEWWAREKDESDMILGDERVKTAAKAEGLENLRTTARVIVEGLFKQGLERSDLKE